MAPTDLWTQMRQRLQTEGKLVKRKSHFDTAKNNGQRKDSREFGESSHLGPARKRILHVVECWGGGVQNAVETFISNTPEYDHRVIARIRPGTFASTVLNEDILTLQSCSVGKFLVFSALRAHRGDEEIIHLHSSLAGLIRILPIRKRVVFTPHCYAFERTDLSGIKRRLLRHLEKLLSKRGLVAGISPRECSLAKSVGRARSVHFVPNVARIPNQIEPSQGDSIVGMGRLAPQKSPELFAEIAKMMRPLGTRFVWIGGGEDRYVRLLEDSGVEVTGWLKHEEAMRILAESLAYLHVAEWEGTPIALLEAAALGKPIVARDIPAFAGLDIIRVAPDPEELVKTLTSIVCDDSVKEEASVISRKLSTKHSAGLQNQSLLAIYS